MKYELHVRRYAPFDIFGLPGQLAGFKGDGDKRGPTHRIHNVKSKTVGVYSFDTGALFAQSRTDTSGSGLAVNCGLNCLSMLFSSLATATATTLCFCCCSTTGPVNATLTNQSMDQRSLHFESEITGSNPMLKAVAPPIITTVDFSADYDRAGLITRCSCIVGGTQFPACDVVLYDVKNQRSALLIDYDGKIKKSDRMATFNGPKTLMQGDEGQFDAFYGHPDYQVLQSAPPEPKSMHSDQMV